MANIIEVPNREYIELHYIKETATGVGLNKQFIMENCGDGTFKFIDGKFGIKVGRKDRPKTGYISMEEWDDVYIDRLERGYMLFSTKKMDKKVIETDSMSLNGKSFKPCENLKTQEIIERLLGFASQAVEENISQNIADIPDEMLEKGQELLNDLADNYENMSVAEFNAKLMVFYQTIPRRIDKLSKLLAKRPVDIQNRIAAEQEFYDVLKAQLRGGSMVSADKDILEAYNMQWRPVNEDEEKFVKKTLGSNASTYIRAWRVINNRTEAEFDAFCKKENLTDGHGIDHLWHGSKHENWWSIITNGLTINPHGVQITGKAYGYGTYFAPSSQKSFGYTSFRGSKWANGNQNSGFLGIYKVATGKRWDGNTGRGHCTGSRFGYNELQQVCPGAHSTWAEARYSGFMMDEVIVYKDNQSTIEYLVECGR